MSSPQCSEENLRKLYHLILKHEARLICGNSQQNIEGVICNLKGVDYHLTKRDLDEISDKASVSSKCIDELLRRGFLIRVDDGKFRSFHFDLLLRASDLRVGPFTGKMTTQTLFLVGKQITEDITRAALLPSPNSSIDKERELWDLLVQELGGYAQLYVDVLREYFRNRGSSGFTYFQLHGILEALKNYRSVKAIFIGAPAGSGKTEVFLSIMLYKILKDLKERRRSKVLIIYPRKFLEIDQAHRIIELLRIANDRLGNLNKLKMAIRDGDTHALEKRVQEEIDKCKKGHCGEVPFRGIKCLDRGELYIDIDINGGKIICKEDNSVYDYSFVEWSRGGSKEARIIVTNLHTYFNRIIDIREDNSDLDVRDIVDVDLIILDEAHEYEPVELGLLHYMLKFMNKVGGREVKLVVSSATLTNAREFAEKLSGGNALTITFEDVLRSASNKINDLINLGKTALAEKFAILAIIFVHPQYSWETYASQLAILTLFTNLIHEVLGMRIKQAVIFLNNVREVNRLHTIIENDLSKGSPLDNAGLRKQYSRLDPIKYRYSLKHYGDLLREASSKGNTKASEILNTINQNGQIKDQLFPKLAKVFADVKLEERQSIAERLSNKQLYTVIATSSLELGVDYPGISIVANIGLDKLSSVVQRFGRAGRRLHDTLNTVLALMIIRNNPVEYVRVFNLMESEDVKNIIGGSSVVE
jgi:superfamily II DNA/RNA helicase